jgi:hypothetical protein
MYGEVSLNADTSDQDKAIVATVTGRILTVVQRRAL